MNNRAANNSGPPVPPSFPTALAPPGAPTLPIDEQLIATVTLASRQSPRRRMIVPLHKSPQSTLQRMLNGIQPYSYIRPHRHLHPPKAESVIILRGELWVLLFSSSGEIEEVCRLQPDGPAVGYDAEPETYHTFLSASPDTVIFEVKPGPYSPANDKDFAPWAPEEYSSEVDDYLIELYSTAGKLLA